MLAAGAHVFVVGSYSSADARTLLLIPPATRTSPLGRSVAVCFARATAMLAAGDHVFVAGPYSSAEAGASPSPPAARTMPFGRSVAVCASRACAMVPAVSHAPRPARAGAVMDRTNEPTRTAAPHAA